MIIIVSLFRLYMCVRACRLRCFSSMTKILVVDDEQDLCEILHFNLSNEGFEVSTANSAEDALEQLKTQGKRAFSLILLDVMMDCMSGFEMARYLRKQGCDIPIIFLTARDHHDDQIAGFEIGADDYITKPFSFDTVLARIKAVLKRTQPATSLADSNILSFGGLQIDMGNARVSIQGKNVELTHREYHILCLLAQHPHYHFTREEIMIRVWPDYTLVSDRSVDVHIARLRKKLDTESWRLISRTGFGYAFVSSNPKIEIACR